MSAADFVFRYDQVLAQGLSSAKSYWEGVPGELRTVDLLVDLQRVYLERRKWHESAIDSAVRETLDVSSDGRVLRSLLTGIYHDRIQHGHRPHIQEFRPWLRGPYDETLRVEGDPCGLGYKIRDRYYLDQRLGSGGFGVVFHAFDEELRCDVAVKIPHRRYWRDPVALSIYLREARTLAKLQHPGIARIFDVGSVGAEFPLYIVSQYIDGCSLDRWVKGRDASLHDRVQLLLAVAEALQHAHANGITHRDIKPENILVDTKGNPRVVDFGIALRDADLGRVETRYAGTVPYMSPEQARGEGHRVDGRSDIFSLGIVFYELITGRRPFDGPNQREVREQILGKSPKPISQCDAPISREVERICLKMLANATTDRYQVASDLVDELRGWLDQNCAPSWSVTPKERNQEMVSTVIVPRGLRAFDAEDSDSFLSLLPGPFDHHGLPTSVSFWKNWLDQRESRPSHGVGVLYGPSGCGKSSLIKAGVIPRLDASIKCVYVEATREGTERQLRQQLCHRVPNIDGSLALPDIVRKLRDRSEYDVKIVLIVDQFEQWLHHHRQFANSELVLALRQCDGVNVQAILMVRDDFWMAISRFMRALEIPILEGVNSVGVDLFDEMHARDVLVALGTAYGRLPAGSAGVSGVASQFIDGAIAELSEDRRVVCVRLALFAEMMKNRPWSAAELKRIGGADGIGTTFLEEEFDARTAPPLQKRHQRAALRVLVALLPETGVRLKGHSRSQADLQMVSGYEGRNEDFGELILVLDSVLRLITPVENPDLTAEETTDVMPRPYYQLTHDYLVPAIREWNSRKEDETVMGRAYKRLKERAILWEVKRERRQLPGIAEFVAFLALTQAGRRTIVQQQMMRTAAKFHGLRTLTVSVLLFVTVAFGSWQYSKTRTAGLIEALKSSQPSRLTQISETLEPWLDYAKSDLVGMLTPSPGSLDPQKTALHARIALSRTDALQVGPLVTSLDSVELSYIPSIRDALRNHDADALPQLWNAFHDEHRTETARFRTGLVLASLDAASKEWTTADVQLVVDQLLLTDAMFHAELHELLRPSQARLIPVLKIAFANGKLRETQQIAAANALRAFLSDNVVELTELLCYATPEQYARLWPVVEGKLNEQCRDHLRAVMQKRPSSSSAIAERVASERQSAGAAITLLHAHETDRIHPIFDGADNLGVVSQFVHGCRVRGVDAAELWRLMTAGLDTDAGGQIKQVRNPARDKKTYACLLALGDYLIEDLPERERAGALVRLHEIYRGHQSSAVHAAAGWTLRKWGGHDLADTVDHTVVPYQPGREWFVMQVDVPPRSKGSSKRPAPLYFTFVVFPPGRYTLGEAGVTSIDAAEPEHVVEITYHFAVLDREISMAECIAFSPNHRQLLTKYGAELVDPAFGMSWNDSANFCVWLTTQARGVDTDAAYRWIATPEEEENRAVVVELDLTAPGFRLPTEAEWEIACRAGNASTFSFGDDETLLPYYGVSFENAKDGAMPIKSFRPNQRGMFDMHGNITEWCHDSHGSIPQAVLRDYAGATPSFDRCVRGGSFVTRHHVCESAIRDHATADTKVAYGGFRIGMTLPEAE